METKKENKKRTKTQIFSRVCGYLRPVSSYNEGKAEEFKDRKTFTPSIKKANLEDKDE